MNKPTHIIIHHSLTKDSETVSWGAIKRYHVETLGWSDIGYHYGVERVGDVFKVFSGRDENVTGAHTVGMNSKSIGICCVGNYDLISPPYWMLAELQVLVKKLMKKYTILVENVRGHHDYAAYKSCPGNLFDMEDFRKHLL